MVIISGRLFVKMQGVDLDSESLAILLHIVFVCLANCAHWERGVVGGPYQGYLGGASIHQINTQNKI